jgi:DNA invertase Pin-like site-specific DNA recombinase
MQPFFIRPVCWICQILLISLTDAIYKYHIRLFRRTTMPKKVVAYCRVSSDHDDQLNSLENQKQHWKEYIKSRPDMEFGGLYVDEGITGTSTLKRADFMRMIRDAARGRFDLILTKEVSRFGRNIVDVLKYTRYLKELKVGVYFESDGIHTLDSDGELRLSIMATLAQEESRKTSQRVQWGHKRAMKNGIVFGADRILGYNLNNKALEIKEDEADIVRRIYGWYLDGYSLHSIADKLNAAGIKGRMGGRFNHSSIRSILQNEKYCGDLVQGKYFTEDYLTHKPIKNKGQKDFIVIRDNHPAIISRDVWSRVQAELRKRQRRYREEGVGYTRHVWGGKIICGICSSRFRRKVYKNGDGSPRPVWICPSYNNKGTFACQNGRYIREDMLERILIDTLKEAIPAHIRQRLLHNIMDALNKSLQCSSTCREIENIKKQLSGVRNKRKKLLDLYIDGNLPREDYNRKSAELAVLENQLCLSLERLEDGDSRQQNKEARLNRLSQVLSRKLEFDEFNEALARECLDRIIVHKKTLQVYLLSKEYTVDLDKYPKRVNGGDNKSRGVLG